MNLSPLFHTCPPEGELLPQEQAAFALLRTLDIPYDRVSGDPADDMESRSDRIVRRLEKRYLRILMKQRNHEELTRRERIQKRIYRAGRKLRLLPELADSLFFQFSVEESIREVAERDA